jgi:hypothetical protein
MQKSIDYSKILIKLYYDTRGHKSRKDTIEIL